MIPLKIAVTRYPHTAALFDGSVSPPDIRLDFVEFSEPVAPTIFRRMARDLEFDVCEMGISTALGAVECGLPFAPLPIFLTRTFDFGKVFVHRQSGIEQPKDLEGKRIGVRSPFITDVLWTSGMLADDFGVNLDTVTWVTVREETIPTMPLPENVELRLGSDIDELVTTGEVDAIFSEYAGSSPEVQRLLPDYLALQGRWLEQVHFIPMHHALVVRNSVLTEHPGVGSSIVRAFIDAKRPFLDRLSQGQDVMAENDSPLSLIVGAHHDYGVDSTAELIRPDPMPYGIEPNRELLDRYVRYAVSRHLMTNHHALEDLFAGSDVSD